MHAIEAALKSFGSSNLFTSTIFNIISHSDLKYIDDEEIDRFVIRTKIFKIGLEGLLKMKVYISILLLSFALQRIARAKFLDPNGYR